MNATTWRAGAFALLVTGVVGTFSLRADTQPRQRDPQAQPEGRRPPDGRRAQRMNRLRERMLKKKVGLSDSQITRVVAIFDGQQAERQELDRRVRTSQRAMGELLRDDSDDQAAFAAQLRELDAASEGFEALKRKQLRELAEVLAPKEQAKLMRAMQQVKRRLERRRRNRRR